MNEKERVCDNTFYFHVHVLYILQLKYDYLFLVTTLKVENPFFLLELFFFLPLAFDFASFFGDFLCGFGLL